MPSSRACSPLSWVGTQRPPLGWDSQQLPWSGGADLCPLPTVAHHPSWYRVQSWGRCEDRRTEASRVRGFPEGLPLAPILALPAPLLGSAGRGGGGGAPDLEEGQMQGLWAPLGCPTIRGR